MATTLFLVRHGEVENPDGILYGRLPGFGLSEVGRRQLEETAQILGRRAPIDELHASPMQRAQESADILAAKLGVAITTDERLLETDIAGYQGGSFDALPRPYITEEPEHEGIECARSMRQRLLAWAQEVSSGDDGRRIAAVSHRDPLVVALLHWTNRGLTDLPGFDLPQGCIYEVVLDGGPRPAVMRLEG